MGTMRIVSDGTDELNRLAGVQVFVDGVPVEDVVRVEWVGDASDPPSRAIITVIVPRVDLTVADFEMREEHIDFSAAGDTPADECKQ